jgi:hypothetical protein
MHVLVSFENLHRASQCPTETGRGERLSKMTDALVSKRLGLDDLVRLGDFIRGLVLGSKDGDRDLESLGVLGVDHGGVD